MKNEINTNCKHGELLDILDKILPPVFRGRDLDAMTGNVLRWRTFQNKSVHNEALRECFTKLGSRKVVVIRDRFLDWLAQDIKKFNI